MEEIPIYEWINRGREIIENLKIIKSEYQIGAYQFPCQFECLSCFLLSQSLVPGFTPKIKILSKYGGTNIGRSLMTIFSKYTSINRKLSAIWLLHDSLTALYDFSHSYKDEFKDLFNFDDRDLIIDVKNMNEIASIDFKSAQNIWILINDPILSKGFPSITFNTDSGIYLLNSYIVYYDDHYHLIYQNHDSKMQKLLKLSHNKVEEVKSSVVCQIVACSYIRINNESILSHYEFFNDSSNNFNQVIIQEFHDAQKEYYSNLQNGNFSGIDMIGFYIENFPFYIYDTDKNMEESVYFSKIDQLILHQFPLAEDINQKIQKHALLIRWATLIMKSMQTIDSLKSLKYIVDTFIFIPIESPYCIQLTFWILHNILKSLQYEQKTFHELKAPIYTSCLTFGKKLVQSIVVNLDDGFQPIKDEIESWPEQHNLQEMSNYFTSLPDLSRDINIKAISNDFRNISRKYLRENQASYEDIFSTSIEISQDLINFKASYAPSAKQIPTWMLMP